MAVDTRNRRASVLGFALAALAILPAPDATIDAADQQQLAYSYPGILVAPPNPIPDMTRAIGVLVRPASSAVDVQVSAVSLATGIVVT